MTWPCFYAIYLLLYALLVVSIQTQCPWDSTIPSLRIPGTCVLPIDKNAEARQDSPWTHPPYCVIPSSPEAVKKFCVYSSSDFNVGSGISLVTKPETAASIAGAVLDPLPAWRSRGHLAGRGRVGTDHDDLPYQVMPILGKGLGVIATRRIRQFESILTSFPAMIVDDEVFAAKEGHDPLPEGTRLFQQALDQLTDKTRFLDLAKSRVRGVHVVDDVIRTNAFGITVGGQDMKGVYPEIAVCRHYRELLVSDSGLTGGLNPSQRLNHACSPNAYCRFTRRDLAMSAVATRNIEPGEEITISYIPLGMPAAQRARTIANWGFNCTCDLCSARHEAREASDKRRERLVEVHYAMQDESTSYEALVELTREFIKLAQVEQLLAKVGEYYQSFMRIYYGVGDGETARKYGRAALKFAEIFSDPEGEFCTSIRRDLQQLDEELSREERSRAGGK